MNKDCMEMTNWTKTVWKRKIANVTIHQHTELFSYHLLYTVEWLHLHFFKMYLSLFKWSKLCYLSTDSFKFGTTMKRTFTCFPLHMLLNLLYMKHICENWTFISVQELFFLSVHIISIGCPCTLLRENDLKCVSWCLRPRIWHLEREREILMVSWIYPGETR